MENVIRAALRAAGVALSIAALAACSGHTEAPPAPTVQAPLSPRLAQVYARSCANCHAQPATGAPQAGDRAAWAPRVAQGRQVLLDHAINGYKGMPPLGTCMDCTSEDFTALIDYMAGLPPERH